MVRRTYVGVTDPVHQFDALVPHVLILRELQALCAPMSADDDALHLAVDGLETAAFHFTRRPHYYEASRVVRVHGQNYFEGLGDLGGCVTAFERLEPLVQALTAMQGRCRPFGRDYLALGIPLKCLTTAAYHFTRLDHFYGADGDSVRPSRPRLERAALARGGRR